MILILVNINKIGKIKRQRVNRHFHSLSFGSYRGFQEGEDKIR